MKGPAQAPGPRIVGANVSRRRGQSLAHQTSDDQQVLIDHARRGHPDGYRLWIAAKSHAQIHAPRVAETLDRAPRLRIDGIKPVLVAEKDPTLLLRFRTRFPIGYSAIAPSPRPPPFIWIEAPKFFSVRRVERKHAQLRRSRIQDAVDDHWIALHLRALERVARVIAPCHREPADVFAIDLF